MAYPKESQRLREMLEAGARISWEDHAEKQAKRRKIPRFLCERVIRGCSIRAVSVDPDGVDRWEVHGRDPDGKAIKMVVKPTQSDTITVVTAIRVQ